MNLLGGNIKPIYFKYLSAAFGSAMITSVYSLVDMAMVGQYQGPDGTAALAVVAPVWNIIYSLGLLMGIGGSVIFSTVRGQETQKSSNENEYFTVAVIGSVIFAFVSWAAIIFFDKPILLFFGADSSLLSLAESYLTPVKAVIPLFLFNQMLAAFLRNDNHPELATAAGSGISFAVMLSHFWSKKNTLVLRKPTGIVGKLREISITGFPTFFFDIAIGILTVLFNRQIMKYLGSNALAVYGPVINVSTIVQCCAYSVGQASQPIISINFGAKKWQRIKETLRYALYTVGAFSIFWTALSLICPNLYIYIFMKPTKAILEIAPAIIRCYSISFLLLPLNIFSTYYFQVLMKPKAAFLVSVFRGCIISGILIMLLPILTGADSIWFAMPITELFVAVYAVSMMKKYTKALSKEVSL
ncbi:MATE family efflux transporter [Parablautia intestinalis]|uniref:MATE family efflux transporter n=1 Tax=Parablautia intestinalis TaxID=2320100 RepID=UPI00256F239B|nr:MATE family efflux transporter [Parablautia intestinalis]